MTLFDSPAFEGHEAVHSFFDERTGLKAIVAVHSTARGPALGGCRMWRYDDSVLAMRDAMRLSRAMTFKNAVADLPLGGGKGVIMLPPEREISPRRRRDLLLIALSGHAREEDRTQSLEAGFDHHLTKPANVDMLKRLLS